MGFLEEISEHKKYLIKEKKKYYRECEKKASSAGGIPGRFFDALSSPGISFIAEVKTSSPLKGRISEYSKLQLAEFYEEAGADALSVLTEEKYFNGSADDIAKVKKVFSGPVLMKDFVVSEYQIFEAAVSEADAVLLISELLGKKRLKKFISLAEEAGLDVLAEAHSRKALEESLEAGARIAGVNIRDLGSLKLHPERALELLDTIPEDVLGVAESGIGERSRVIELENAGFDAVLVGSSLVSDLSPKKKLRELMGK